MNWLELGVLIETHHIDLTFHQIAEDDDPEAGGWFATINSMTPNEYCKAGRTALEAATRVYEAFMSGDRT